MQTAIDSEHIGGDLRVMWPEAVVVSCSPGVTVLLLTIQFHLVKKSRLLSFGPVVSSRLIFYLEVITATGMNEFVLLV